MKHTATITIEVDTETGEGSIAVERDPKGDDNKASRLAVVGAKAMQQATHARCLDCLLGIVENLQASSDAVHMLANEMRARQTEGDDKTRH